MSDNDASGYTRRSGPSDRGLRVGDSEREAVADILREQHLQGRLASDEFQERLERCLAAKTYAELDVLLSDFPTAEEPGRRERGRQQWAWPFALVPLVVIAVAASGGRLFWLAFPLVFFFFFFFVRPLLWRSRNARRRGLSACGPRYTTGGRA